MKLFQAIQAKYGLARSNRAATTPAVETKLKPQYGRRKNMRDYRDF